MQKLAEGLIRLDAHDYKVMAWKNGLGSTTEIAISPAGTSLAKADFDWRISLADVPTDADFSPFPGYDRTLMLASGNGLELHYQEAPSVRLPGPGSFARFSGDWHTQCTLLDGPVRDFNVMTARGRVEHSCEVFTGGGGQVHWSPRQETLFCYCLRGTVVMKMRDVAEWNLTGHQSGWLPASPDHPDEAILALAPHSQGTLVILLRMWASH